MMHLVLPNEKYKKSYYELIESAKKYGDYSELGNAYREGETFSEMIRRLKNRRVGKNIANRDVPATIYWIIEKNKVVGTIDLRHKLNKDYFERLGHIAYYIKPEERNKGYGTKALSLALNKYKKKYVKKVLITCLKENIASAKIIENNSGVLEKTYLDKKTGKEIYRYWINVLNDEIIIPNTAWITTNRTCNNKCNWCYAYNCKDKNMKYEDIKDYVNELAKININKIVLIGGEPTIYDDISKTIKYITNKGIEVSMASNGRMFSDFNFAKKLVKSGLKNCNISIKGHNEEEYIKNTNAKGFEEMIEGYKNLKKLGINVSLSYVICDKDHKKFDQFLKVFEEKKLNNLLLELYKPSAKENENSYNAPTITDLAEMCKYTFNKLKNKKISFAYEMSIPLCCLEEETLNEMIEKKCISTCCHISKGTGIIFDSNFDILPCNHFVNHPLNTEKINSKNILEFWNSDNAKEFRKVVKTYPSHTCQKCKLWKQCGGGCFLRWLSTNPDNYINNKYLEGGD